ncbi:hypothetical protein CN444_25650 [Bacillus thuringiensis]|nr:hypothetical protein CN444_25650 [Bacillus thuringiensis]
MVAYELRQLQTQVGDWLGEVELGVVFVQALQQVVEQSCWVLFCQVIKQYLGHLPPRVGHRALVWQGMAVAGLAVDPVALEYRQ